MMAQRTPNRTRAMMERGEYWIRVCRICGHPGGAHFLDDGCTCPSCPGYDESPEWAVWSNEEGHALRSRPDARNPARRDTAALPEAEGLTDERPQGT